MFEEWVVDGPFIITPRISFEVLPPLLWLSWAAVVSAVFESSAAQPDPCAGML